MLRPYVNSHNRCCFFLQSLGNHEFDNGVSGLVPFLNALKFPVVTANVDFAMEPTLAATPLTPSHIVTVGNHKIGIIGYLTPETKIISQTENVIINDEVPSIKEESEKLKQQGVKTIIALGHSGFEMDKIIAEKVPLVDVVIGGHTNTFLYNGPPPDIETPEGLYPTVITQASGKKVPVVQAYAYTKYMGQLKLIIGEDGKVKSYDGQPLLLNSSVPQEPDVLQVLEKYRPAVNELDQMVVGRTKVVLDNADCRKQECNFGNMIADAFIAYKSYYYGGNYWTDTPISIQNGGGIRNSIDARHSSGNITRGDLLGVLPFDNRMIAISLNGSDVIKMLETGLRSNGETSKGEYLQVSGLKVVYDSRRPTGSRVVSVSARCSMCTVPSYSKIDPNKEYRLMVTQFILNGGDGFSVVKDKAYKITAEDINDADMVSWYLGRYNPVYPENSGRLIDLAMKDENVNTKGAADYTKPKNIYTFIITLLVVMFSNKLY